VMELRTVARQELRALHGEDDLPHHRLSRHPIGLSVGRGCSVEKCVPLARCPRRGSRAARITYETADECVTEPGASWSRRPTIQGPRRQARPPTAIRRLSSHVREGGRRGAFAAFHHGPGVVVR
jgi:hypothetical protein